MSDTWNDYGDEWDLDPGYVATLDRVVQQAIKEQTSFLDGLFYSVVFLWMVHGGIRNRDQRRWEREILPVLDAANVQAAERGATFTRLMHSLNTSSKLDTAVANLRLETNPDFQKLSQRSRRYASSPVTYARWLLSRPEGEAAPKPPDKTLKRAVDDAKRVAATTSVKDSPAAAAATAAPEKRRYSDVMVMSASRVAEQAVGDATRAYSIGAEAGANVPGTMVERWLKIPNAKACSWCFTVAARGYRTAQSVARHTPIDHCGCRPIWVAANRRRKGEQIAGNEDWKQALIDAGYGALVDAWKMNPADMPSTVRDLIYRPEDFAFGGKNTTT